MPNKKISQLDVRSSPTLADLLAIADPSTGYAYKITGTNLQTVLEIPNKVPYTGATANVNLGAYSITATNIIRAGGLATQFLKADGSVDSTTYMNRAVYDTDGNGVVDAAEKMQTIGRNSTGVTLYKGTIVYISGSTGNRPNFVKAQANSEATSAGTFGVVVSDIANNSDGYVATIGTLADLDTRTTATNPFTSVTLADGDTLYLDPNTAGYVTNVKPSAPNHIVYVGKVVRTSPTLGTIVYRIQNGYELAEIHDVSISSVANNDVLVYETATTLWKNKSIATILGYTPQVQLNGTGFVKASGTTISYDNTTYATDSLVVHLAGAENITGVKTFQNALQTTAGNNLLNTGGGNTVIGYTADPATSASYKLDVNGQSRFVGNILSFNGSNLLGGIYTSSGWGRLDLYYGSLAVRIDPSSTSYMCLGGANLVLGATTGNNSALLYMESTGAGLRIPNMTTVQKNAIATPATSLLVYDTTLASFQYYTGSAWAGLGSGISGSGTAGQVTYWSGTSAVTGSSDLTINTTTGRLIFSKVIDGALAYNCTNTSTGVNAQANYSASNGTNSVSYGVYGTSATSYGALSANNGFFYSTRGIVYMADNASNGILQFATGGNTEKMRIYTNGNLMLQNGGTFTDGGQRLQVIGSMRVGTTAASAMYWDDTNNRLGIGTSSPNSILNLVNSFNGTTSLNISNTTTGTASESRLALFSSNGQVQFGKYSSTTTTYKTMAATDAYLYNSTGNISILNDAASGNINFAAGGSSTAHMTIKSNGRINMSSLPTSATGLSAGDLWNNLGIVSIV